jgi:undecaprenyl-phosphate galactose phosphotransferase
MSKLGIIKCGLETLCTWLLLLLFPFPMNIRFRFLIVWVLMQFIAGRYRHKALLVWDELKFLLVSYICGYIASLM